MTEYEYDWNAKFECCGGAIMEWCLIKLYMVEKLFVDVKVLKITSKWNGN